MLRVLRQRDFSLLWFAGLISLTGDMMLVVALPVAVYELTGSALATGGLLIARSVPTLVLGSVAGVFVDRWDRKVTMVVANLVRAPILLLLLLVDSADRLWIVYLVTFLTSIFSRFFRPAENAMLPRLVAEENLIPANSLNSLNNNLSLLVGPALGGLIAAQFGLSGVAVADAASFLVAGLLILAIVTPSRVERSEAPETEGVRQAWANVWHEALAGLRLIRENATLRVVFIVMAISSIGEGVFSTAIWVFIDETLNGGPREAGWILSAQAVGGLIGALVIGSKVRRAEPLRMLGWGAIGLGTIDLMTFNYPAFVPGIWLALIFMAIVGVPASAFGTGYTTAIQTEAEDAYRGRVFGALDTTVAMLAMLGAVIAGVATARLGPVVVLSIDSLAYVAGGVFALQTLGSRVVRRTTEDRQPLPET
jgi:MFS family permease